MHDSAIVGDFRTLRALERAGFVTLHGSAHSWERHWTGYRVRVIHVSAGPKLANWYEPFTFRGREYRLRYFDGCFHAFVTRTDRPAPAFV